MFLSTEGYVSEDLIALGAMHDDDNGNSSGSVYVFRWNGSSWIEEQKLLPSDGAAGDIFGRYVGINGQFIIVGTWQGDGVVPDSGAAYIFRYSGSSWDQELKLQSSDGATGDAFSWGASFSGSVAVLGAFLDDDNGPNSGSAYVFDIPPVGIPVVSEWGLIAMSLLMLTVGTLVLKRRHRAQHAA